MHMSARRIRQIAPSGLVTCWQRVDGQPSRIRGSGVQVAHDAYTAGFDEDEEGKDLTRGRRSGGPLSPLTLVTLNES